MKNSFTLNDPPGQTAFPIARAGYPYIFAAAFTTAVFALLELTIPALLGLMVTFCICAFFRDPDRLIPTGDEVVVAPADGKVILAERVENSHYVNGPSLKISIFMTVFNVHVNRIPHSAIVEKIVYNPGRFFSANLDKASKDNEQNAVYLRTREGRELCMVQIAGLVARRIICGVQPGDEVKTGQKMGLICFGSRVDVYLPEESRPEVKVGDKVKGGCSILGYLQ